MSDSATAAGQHPTVDKVEAASPAPSDATVCEADPAAQGAPDNSQSTSPAATPPASEASEGTVNGAAATPDASQISEPLNTSTADPPADDDEATEPPSGNADGANAESPSSNAEEAAEVSAKEAAEVTVEVSETAAEDDKAAQDTNKADVSVAEEPVAASELEESAPKGAEGGGEACERPSSNAGEEVEVAAEGAETPAPPDQTAPETITGDVSPAKEAVEAAEVQESAPGGAEGVAEASAESPEMEGGDASAISQEAELAPDAAQADGAALTKAPEEELATDNAEGATSIAEVAGQGTVASTESNDLTDQSNTQVLQATPRDPAEAVEGQTPEAEVVASAEGEAAPVKKTKDGEKPKRRKRKPTEFVKPPVPCQVDASIYKERDTPCQPAVFEVPPRVAKAADVSYSTSPEELTAKAASPSTFEKSAAPSCADVSFSSEILISQKRAVFSSHASPSMADVNYNSPTIQKSTTSLFVSPAKESTADTGANAAGLTSVLGPAKSVYESTGQPSLAAVRACDPVPNSVSGPSFFTKPAAETIAHARSGVDIVRDETNVTSVFESAPKPVPVTAKWCDPVLTKASGSVFESKAIPSHADAAADRSLDSDDEYETDTDEE